MTDSFEHTRRAVEEHLQTILDIDATVKRLSKTPVSTKVPESLLEDIQRTSTDMVNEAFGEGYAKGFVAGRASVLNNETPSE